MLSTRNHSSPSRLKPFLGGAVEQWTAPRGSTLLENGVQRILEGIKDRVKMYGAEYTALTTGLDEESERELEKETELEEEVGLEIPRRTPAREQDWDYASILSMHSASEVAGLSSCQICLRSTLTQKITLQVLPGRWRRGCISPRISCAQWSAAPMPPGGSIFRSSLSLSTGFYSFPTLIRFCCCPNGMRTLSSSCSGAGGHAH